MVIMMMINLNQAKLMNEENWVELELGRIGRKKTKKSNRWIGSERKKRRGMKSNNRKGGNVKEY